MTDNLTFEQQVAEYCYAEIFCGREQHEAIEAEALPEVIENARQLLDSDYAGMMGSAYNMGEAGTSPEKLESSALMARAKKTGNARLIAVLQCLCQRGYALYAEMNAGKAVEAETTREAELKAKERAAKEAIINATHHDLSDEEVAVNTPREASWKNHCYDAIIHTLGRDTNLPCYFSFIQFQTAKTHIFITSNDNECKKRLMALYGLLPKDGRAGYKFVDPFKPRDSYNAICEAVNTLTAKNPKIRIGVDLTGGTKLMFIGGLRACTVLDNADPFYFDINEENVLFLDSNELPMPFRGINDISGFLVASGFQVNGSGKWDNNPVREARAKLTKFLFTKRELLGKLYGTVEFKAELAKQEKNHPHGDQSFDELRVGEDKLRVKYDGFKAKLMIDGEIIDVPLCRDFFKYISGGWLEEYAYLYFRNKKAQGTPIYDLRIGVKVSPREGNSSQQAPVCGEFDCVYTDGKRLYIVECKAGKVTQDHIHKLENNVKNYGGNDARGILFSSFLDTAARERIARLPALRAITGADALF